jgi:hypothetical protein
LLDCRQEIRGQARRGGTRSTRDELIRKGKRSAQLLTKARILLKADVSDAGEGWSDSRIAAALDTSIATVERTRRQLVEEGFEAVLARKYNSNSARPRIFDGVAEAKLMHDPQRPLVCLDETSKQLIVETRAPIPAKPWRKARHD